MACAHSKNYFESMTLMQLVFMPFIVAFATFVFVEGSMSILNNKTHLSYSMQE